MEQCAEAMAAYKKGELRIDRCADGGWQDNQRRQRKHLERTMGNLEIRQAKKEDIRAVSLLCGELYEEMAILRPDCYTAGRVDDDWLRSAVEDHAQKLIVAAEHGAIVGFVRIAERTTPSHGPNLSKKYALITGLAVDPAYRGIDIGTALISEAKTWAKGRGLHYLEFYVLSESAGAVRFLKKEDFETVAQTMRCSV
jgi:ribosomal protein S18 acetylase RimI-like enzyme